MATMDYVEIPSYATRLRSDSPSTDLRPAPKIVTSLPRPEHSPVRSSSSPASTQPMSPSRVGGSNLTSILLTSALQLPANTPTTPRTYGKAKDAPRLLSTRDPLSIPITTVNFRRFVARAGSIFWLQDRVEEIVLWKRSWKYTLVWMAAYAFLCYFPRLILLLPHAIVLSVLLAMHPVTRGREQVGNLSPKVVQPMPPTLPSEGSADWLANLQAIQNLMGAVSDGHDFAVQLVPYLTWSSPYSGLILTSAIVTLFAMIPLVYMLPMRATCLVGGLLPFAFTHPFTQHTLLPTLQSGLGPLATYVHACVFRLIDNDNLEDRHWRTELREVELYENERWAPGPSGSSDDVTKAEGTWSKNHLKAGERKAWTRGRDGWSGVSDDGSGEVSNLTFSLAPGWLFVETEDWRPDLEGVWADGVGADENGWVYTNDVWLQPHPHPVEEWKSAGGMTRRRRWTRRIYYSPKGSV
ncbi:integral peroxisomal membrane peroxin-domain-containing protein [Earliella scabrosa]|nr:integral peroxisomal membrane peroxin-domain-containing protein [Earliella scabrosa]